MDETPAAEEPIADSDSETQSSTPGATPTSPSFVIGIGASAGGLEALRPLVANLPVNSDLCVIVTQHMAPTHKSLLDQLLNRETDLVVQEAKDGTQLKANCLFVAPAGMDITVEDSVLRLTPPRTTIGPKPSVDLMFTSLAEGLGPRAVGVVLSGTGSDGAYGARALRAKGGLVICQSPDSAKYGGMPESAIETGCVDIIAPPLEIARELSRLILHPRPTAVIDDAPLQGDDAIDVILRKLHARTGVDFLNYKKTTIARRLEQRLATVRVATLDNYLKYVDETPSELDQLCKNVLISVTAFFRDKPAFKALDDALQLLINSKPKSEMIRIWVPGCATGEEAYSIAILLLENQRMTQLAHKVQIFATDIDEDALNVARRGFYSSAAIADLDDELIHRYFVPTGSRVQINKPVRDMVVFARQNVTQDAPFLRMDVISCRNLLIYFNLQLQDRALRLFHYALTAGGYLLLGKSEATSSHGDLFEPVEPTVKLFKRRPGPPALPPSLPSPLDMMKRGPNGTGTLIRRPADKQESTYLGLMQNAALQAFLPISVLVNEQFELVHVHGDVAAFVHLKPGRVDLNLLNLVSEEFRPELRALLHRAKREQITLTGHPRRLDPNRDGPLARLRVHPITGPDETTSYFLIGFEQIIQPEPIGESTVTPSEEQEARIAELDQELTATREHLQTVIEELETSNEELQALNEELQATNEELQSSNEELETSNEELQSTNEELETVNEELQVKTFELGEANADLNNILKSVGFGLVVLDGRGRITRYTDSASHVFDILPEDIGRQILSVPALFEMPDLRSALTEVLEKGGSVEEKVATEHRVFWMKIQPYRNARDKTEGAVLTFADQTEVERANRRIEDLARRNNAILQTAVDAIIVTDAEGVIHIYNEAAQTCFGYQRDEVMGKTIHELAPSSVEAAGRTTIADYLDPKGQALIGTVERALARHKSGKLIPVTLAVSEHDSFGGSIYTAFLRDISDQLRLEDLNAKLVSDLKRSNRELGEFAHIASHDLREPLRMVSSYGELMKHKFGEDLPQNAGFYIDTMIAGCSRMNRLIKELLEYSQLERSEPNFKVVDLSQLVAQTLSDLKVVIRERDAVITVDDLPRVQGDEVRLKQLLQNLVNNATKFARPEVSPAISIKARPIPGDDAQILIQIDDNGQGIEENMADEVFKIFRRLHGDEVEGTGVGLAVCKKIVEIHGGRIWVDTKADPGARFCFTLPRATAPGLTDS